MLWMLGMLGQPYVDALARRQTALMAEWLNLPSPEGAQYVNDWCKPIIWSREKSALFSRYDDLYSKETTPEIYQNSVNLGRLLGAAIAGWALGVPIGHQAQLKNFPNDYIPLVGVEK